MSSRNMANAGGLDTQHENEVGVLDSAQKDTSTAPKMIPESNAIDQAMAKMQLTTGMNVEKDNESVSTTAVHREDLCLDRMPAEVITVILENLAADDLGSARLVNKHIAAVGRRLLCVNINVMETTESLERLMCIASQDEEITRSVRHFYYIAFKSEAVPWAASDKNMEIYRSMGFKDILAGIHQKTISSEKELAKFWEEKGILLKDPSLKVTCLEKAFRIIQPHSITISTMRQGKQRLSHKLYQSLVEHDIRKWNLDGPQTETFVTVLRAAEAAGLRIQHLKAAFGIDLPSHPAIKNIEKVFEGVLILDLALVGNDMGILLPGGHSHGHSKKWPHDDQAKLQLARFMQKAQGLQELSLTLFSSRIWSAEEYLMLRNLHWPDLKSLEIFNCSNRMADLCEFVELHAKTLKKLCLSDLSFKFVSGKKLSFVELCQFFLEKIQEGTLNLWVFKMEGKFCYEGEFDEDPRRVSGPGMICLPPPPRNLDFEWCITSSEQSLAEAFGAYVDLLAEVKPEVNNRRYQMEWARR